MYLNLYILLKWILDRYIYNIYIQNHKNTWLNGQYFYLVILYDSVTFSILTVGMVMLPYPQLCLTLCDPLDLLDPLWPFSQPGSSVGIFQAKILEYWSGLHFLLQGLFLTEGLNQGLLCLLLQADSLPLSHQGSHFRVGKLIMTFQLFKEEGWLWLYISKKEIVHINRYHKLKDNC